MDDKNWRRSWNVNVNKFLEFILVSKGYVHVKGYAFFCKIKKDVAAEYMIMDVFSKLSKWLAIFRINETF